MYANNAKIINGKPSGAHPLYRTWKGMRERCNNPNHKDWKYYGGKNICVDSRWNVFENFAIDMGVRPLNHTLDRINSNLNYSKENCRWATHTQQALNQKKRITGFLKGPYKKSKTGAVGVYILTNGKFRAVKFVDGKNLHLGCFKTLDEAIQSRK